VRFCTSACAAHGVARPPARELFVAQSQKHEGDNWWRWSLWIESADKDLDQIAAVTYTLHPTFPDPVQTVTDRASKFQLRCSGWGVFLIPVEVRLKNGGKIQLAHQLQFTFAE
jgi:transcription initiation factor IIF auxiliary subunit